MGATGYGALIGGALGLAKGATIDKDKANRQRELAAATARYSPWTGLQAQPVQEADPWGSALQGATAGAGMGQSFGAANAQQEYQQKQMANDMKLNDAQRRWLDTQSALAWQNQPKTVPPGQR